MVSPECIGTFIWLADTEKVTMSLSRNHASSLLLGTLAAVSMAAGPAFAGDTIDGAQIAHAANRCAVFGPGFVDMGDGTCSRVSEHVRVDLGMRDAGGDTWTTSGTSSATLRSDGLGMLPGASESRHLRVRSGLESYNPFQ